ncbi:MAG: sugar porter family MFS transporter [Verrucomicrobiota bacterium]|jgi:sugar porter (SP) family MFS transporter
MRPSPSAHGSPAFLVLVCLVATLGGLLFGYDTGVISDAIGFLTKHFELTPAMEGWAMSCAIFGCALGAVLAGVVGDRLGRKRLLVLAAFLFAVSSVGTSLPKSLGVFICFRTLAGIGIGMAALASPMYIAEISPARFRGRLVSLNQFAIVTGFLLVYFANYFIARQGSEAWQIEASWRWMFGLGLVPSVFFLIMLSFVPESPRWLVEQGRRQEAHDILARVNGPSVAFTELQAIEASLRTESATLGQLFQPGLRVVLLIGIVLAILQQVTGINAFLYYGPEILKKLGTAADTALLQQIIVGAANLVFTLVAIWTVDRLGRRPLMLLGVAGMSLCLLGMGLAAYYQRIEGWMLLFIVGYIACFAMSVGPVTWVILSEIFPTRVRGRALAAATLFLWIADWAVTQSAPFLNKDPWLTRTFHSAAPFWIYGAMCLIELVFVWRFVPETKGRTLEEIGRSWNRPAAKPE